MNNEYLDTTSYTNKDFRSIWPELIDLVKDLTDKWDPVNSNESDPGVALLKLKAFIADKLNYNIDKNVLEAFPSSVTQRGNAQKLYDSLGYQLKWYQSAITDIHFKYVNPKNSSDAINDADTLITFNIPKFTQVCDAERSIVYTTLENVILDNRDNSQTEIAIKAIQGPINSVLVNGSDTITIANLDADYRIYFKENSIAANGIFVNNVNSDEFWESTFNLESTQLHRKVFKFGVLPTTNECYIEFPQDAAELFGQGINIRYIISAGINGNIKAKTLTTFNQEYPNNGVDDTGKNYNLNTYIKVVNLNGTSSGQDPESLEDAYRNYKRTVNTFSTLVTLDDYINAIYNSNVVSNAVVTDRLTDFNFAYKVKAKNNVGEYDELFSSTADSDVRMNAFNLAIYPLNKVANVYDIDTYNETFKTSTDAYLEAIDAVEENKSIQHDWFDISNKNLLAFLFKNKIGISGQLLTYQKVSTTEAKDIIKNIKTKLYETYQSRNLDYGQDIDLDSLLITIKNSDPRIKEFLIDEPTYNTNVMYSNNSELAISGSTSDEAINEILTNLKTEIVARSILAGVTPLFLFDDSIAYNYTMKSIGSYSLSSGTETPSKDSEISYNEAKETLILPSNPEPNSDEPVNQAYNDIVAMTTQVDVPFDPSRQTIEIENMTYKLSVDTADSGNPDVTVDKPEDTLLSEKFKWANVPTYNPGDIGTAKNSYYLCTKKSYLKEQYWEQILAWSSEKTYAAEAYVIHNNSIYKSKLADNKSNTPSNNSDYWDLIQDTLKPIIYEHDESDTRVVYNDDYSNVSKISYELRPNEQVFFYAPSYISKAQLSTYLNVCLVTNNAELVIPKDSLYKLRSGETLYVSETVITADKSMFATNNKYIPTNEAEIEEKIKAYGKAFRKYESGTIIRPSFELKCSTKGGIQASNTARLFNYVNLESTKTIDIMDSNSTKINKKSQDNDLDDTTKTIYCAWITDDFNNYLFNEMDIALAKNSKSNYIEHILQQNEIFIYTDLTKSDLIILQSGTKIKIPYNSSSFSKDDWKITKPSASKVNQEGLSALEDFWKEIPRNLRYIEVEELEIRTLASGVILENKSAKNPKTLNNIPQPILDPDKIRWYYDNQEYKLPELLLDDDKAKWHAFSRLSVLATPEHAYTLYDNQCLCLFTATEDEDNIKLTPKYVLGPGQSFITNYVTIVPGGIKQDVQVLKEDDVIEPISIAAFDYKEVVDKDAVQQLWKVTDTSQLINTISVSVNSDGVHTTKLQFKDNFTNTQPIILTLSLSKLFSGSGGTIIPIAFDTNNDNMTVASNLATYFGEISSQSGIEIANYKNNIIYLNCNNTSTDLTLTISNIVKNNVLVISLYPPKRYLGFNEECSILSNLETRNNTIDRLKTLSTKSIGNNTEINVFDLTYIADKDDQILNPLDPLSFYRPNHVCNNITMTQIESVDVRLARQSKQ